MRRALLALLLLGASCGSPPPRARIPVGDAPVQGPADAWITVIEFGDFQCPFCARAAPLVHQMRLDWASQLRVAYKHLPLDYHEYALPAAHAAICAHRQGRFWEMYDVLYANPRALEEADLVAAAKRLDLDLAAWDACRADEATQAVIDADVAEARGVPVGSTPAFLINGRLLVGALPYADFKKVVEEELEAAKSSGVDRAEYYERVVLGR